MANMKISTKDKMMRVETNEEVTHRRLIEDFYIFFGAAGFGGSFF